MRITTNNSAKQIIFFFTFFLSNLGLYAQIDILKKTDLITPDSLKKHIEILASDSLEGRKTGERGQKLAADYISKQFSQMGLTPISLSNEKIPWYQSFSAEKLNDNSFITVQFDSIEKPLKGIEKFLSFGRIDNTEPLTIKYEYCQKNAPQMGNGLFIRALTLEDGLKELASNTKKTKDVLLSFPDKTYKALYKEYYFLLMERLILHKSDEDYYNVLFLKERKASSFNLKQYLIPFLASNPECRILLTSDENFKKYFATKELKKAFRKETTTSITTKNIKLTGINSSLKFDTLNTENVIGKIEGTDKKNEVIVICAHYDHLGRISHDRMGGSYNNEICNGADDNASGTSAVIEVAKLFAEMQNMGVKPRRTIVFIAFTGEELGLFGSEFYAQNPISPLNRIKTVINLDMIGRTNKHYKEADNYVLILNKNNKRELNRLSKKNGKLIGLKIDYTIGLRMRLLMNFLSDHRPFVSRDVPAIMISTGEHPDYHTPRDDTNKINYRRATLITRLVFLDAWALANE